MVRMSDVWDHTVAFLKDNFVALIPIALITFWVSSAFSMLLQGLFPVKFAAVVAGAAPPNPPWLGLVNILLSLLLFWGCMTVYAKVLAFAAPARAALRRLPVLLLAYLVAFLVVLLVVGILLVLIFLLAKIMIGSSVAGFGHGGIKGASPILYSVALLLGFLLLCAFLWLIARMMLVMPAIMAGRGLDAFAYSFALTRGMALRIIGVMLLGGVVSWVVALAVTLGLGTVLRLLLGGTGPLSPAGLLTIAVTALIQAGFAVVGTTFVAKLYLALSDRSAAATA